MPRNVLVSVVMPCLNEEKSVGKCVREAVRGIREIGGEVIVVDNGSTDESVAEVRKWEMRSETVKVKLIQEREKGYGAALLRGFREARGEAVVMGDSDGSYDFREIGKLVRPALDGNFDLVVGSRMAGEIEKGAMPWMHRFIGTPMLTGLANWLFGLKLTDSQSGFRAIRRQAYEKLGMRMRGMEFASEMLVRAKRAGLTIGEVPITYRKRGGESKLVPVRDAWRHVRFLLLFSPGRLFTVPGVLLFTLGLVFFVLTAPGPFVWGKGILDVHTLSISGMVMLLGFQLMSLGMFSRVYGKYSFGIREDDFIDYFIERFQLEQGLRAGSLLGLAGLGVLGWVGGGWVLSGFPALSEVRPVIVGTVAVLLGAQMIFGSFFLSFLRGEGR
jgi:glycosyltransferase involved in cell wall biosynthesis